MKGSQDAALKQRLKEMIVAETDREVEPASIGDEEGLFGPDTRLALDSIDGLQVSMALQLQFGLKVTDPKELVRIMRSINTLADAVQPD